MREAIVNSHQVLTDGRTIWISDATGHCIGRFSPAGIDVHRNAQEQLDTGMQCLDCTHTRPQGPDWDRFTASMAQHHAVAVPEAYRPGWIDHPGRDDVTRRRTTT